VHGQTLGERQMIVAVRRDGHNFDVRETRVATTLCVYGVGMPRRILNVSGNISSSTIPIRGTMVGLQQRQLMNDS
jgi:hypothetical protein